MIERLLFAVALYAAAGPAPVPLGTATSFAVLAGETVTNTGPSAVTGDVGVSPGSAVVGFPPGTVTDGAVHAADAVAAQAQVDLTAAYDDAAGRGPPTDVGELGGRTLVPGVYRSPAGMSLTGTLTLDGAGTYVFQAGSTLVTASASRVRLVNGADACDVFWQVGSSATLGTDSVFAGTVMALASVSAQTRAAVTGRLLARHGQVSLDDNTVTRPRCAAAPTTTTATTTPPTTAPPHEDLVPPTLAPPTTVTRPPSPATTTTRPPLPPTPPPPRPLPPTGAAVAATAVAAGAAVLAGLGARRLARRRSPARATREARRTAAAERVLDDFERGT